MADCHRHPWQWEVARRWRAFQGVSKVHVCVCSVKRLTTNPSHGPFGQPCMASSSSSCVINNGILKGGSPISLLPFTLSDLFLHVAFKDILIRLLVLCCRSLLTHWHNSCWADWPDQAGSNRKAERGKSTKLKLLLWYSIHATYGRIQMTDLYKSLSETSGTAGQ